MLSDQIYRHLYNRPKLFQEIIGDLSITSNNDEFLVKCHSGTLRIIDTIILRSLFELLFKHLLHFVFTVRGDLQSLMKNVLTENLS